MTHLIVNERTRKGKQLMEQVKNGYFKANEVKMAANEPAPAEYQKKETELRDLELEETVSPEEFFGALETALMKEYKKKGLA